MSGGWVENVDIAGENALSRYDRKGYNQILLNVRPNGVNKYGPPKYKMVGVTYLRFSDELFESKNFKIFKQFVKKMHADMVRILPFFFCTNMVAIFLFQSHNQFCSLQDYMREMTDVPILRRSKSKIPIEKLLEATEPIKPISWDNVTDMSVGGPFADFLDNILDKLFSVLK